jgi:uncharacterized membrane protein YfcA
MVFKPEMLLILCPLMFFAGFVDSIAGGGGLISIPAYLFAGFPVHLAYGTNKFSACCGTFFSAFRYLKSGQIHLKSAAVSAAGALIGSFLGAKAALAMDEKYLKITLIVILPVIAVFVLTRRGFGEKQKAEVLTNAKMLILSFIIGLVMGAYDGFAGPGTGTFLIFLFTSIIGFKLTTASGNAKIVNLASNISALVTFLFGGQVLFAAGIPAALFGIAGNWLGSGLAIKNGAKAIKPVFVCVLVLLFVKMGLDVIR